MLSSATFLELALHQAFVSEEGYRSQQGYKRNICNIYAKAWQLMGDARCCNECPGSQDPGDMLSEEAEVRSLAESGESCLTTPV